MVNVAFRVVTRCYRADAAVSDVFSSAADSHCGQELTALQDQIRRVEVSIEEGDV